MVDVFPRNLRNAQARENLILFAYTGLKEQALDDVQVNALIYEVQPATCEEWPSIYNL